MSRGLTKAFLNENSVWIVASALFAIFQTETQDIVQSVQSHLDDLCIHDGEQLTQWFDAALLNQEPEK